MNDLADIAKMIVRLEEAGMTRRAIAKGAGIGASQITRIMAGDARNPTFRVVTSLKRFCEEMLDAEPPRRDERFAPGCKPRASR